MRFSILVSPFKEMEGGGRSSCGLQLSIWSHFVASEVPKTFVPSYFGLKRLCCKIFKRWDKFNKTLLMFSLPWKVFSVKHNISNLGWSGAAYEASFCRQPPCLTHKYEIMFQTLARRNNYNLYSRRHDAQQNDTLKSNILHKGTQHNTKNETLSITAYKTRVLLCFYCYSEFPCGKCYYADCEGTFTHKCKFYKYKVL